MNVALSFTSFNDLQGFFSCNIFGVLSAFYQKLGNVADADAHFSFDIADTLATDPLRFPAGADHLTELVIFIKPMRKVLDIHRLRACINGTFYRDNMHADAGAALGNKLSGHSNRFLRGQVEHGGDLRMIIAKSRMLDHIFSGADDPFGDHVLNMLVCIVPVLLEDTDPEEMVDDLLGLFHRHTVLLCQPLGGPADPALLKTQHEFHFILGQKAIQDPEIHVVFLHPARQFPRDRVRDQLSQLCNKLLFLRIIAMIVLRRKITLIDMQLRIYFFYHNYPLISYFLCD